MGKFATRALWWSMFCLSWLAGISAAQAARPVPDAVTPDGGRYYGPLVDGKLHGRGRIEWTNGGVYRGEFRNGQPEGLGRIENKRRRYVYAGHFHLGAFSGQGELRIDARQIYTGSFKHGRFNGQGRYDDGNDTVYEGEFVDDRFTGAGVVTRPDGSRHEGLFDNWRPQGSGKFTAADGTVYEGWFQHGDLIGSARIQRPDGSVYEGEIHNWMPQGQGRMRLANGDLYVGRFSYGYYEGEGTLVYAQPQADGRTSDAGIWSMGRLRSTLDEEERRGRQALEQALYLQAPLLDARLGALQARTPGRINLYLLAVAGDGNQEVFRREVEFVDAAFAERFGTAGHSITLVNAKGGAEHTPIASVTSLRRSLDAIGRRMDKTQDILFVFLTSHGSKTHELSLGLPGHRLPDLGAATLAQALKDTGIRWKVVVVSACYSGGFIDALRDGSTLVITSARADRTSFGCADENDFTYFGRAFFKEALPHSASFEEAYARAKQLIAEWETGDAKHGAAAQPSPPPKPSGESLPQIDSTPEIEAQLKRWWAQFPPPH